MRFDVEHVIRWQYEPSVFIEPMTVRLRPRCDGVRRLLDFQLTIEPSPTGMCDVLDALGNAASLVWFDGKQDQLSVKAVSAVEITLRDPFDYLLTGPDPGKLPLQYSATTRDWLPRYLKRKTVDVEIDDWTREIAAGRDAPAFLAALTDTMFQEFKRTTRASGPALPPAETYHSRQGTCRDLAVLFIDACRHVGIAARFVSGYSYEPDRDVAVELHAWSEVYLPGAGWRGYDPTLGLAVADRHIPLAAAPEPSAAAPTTGTFRRSGAKSTIEFQIEIRAGGVA